MPGWDDNGATFEMAIVANIIHGDYQLGNGYGSDRAQEVLKVKPHVANMHQIYFDTPVLPSSGICLIL